MSTFILWVYAKIVVLIFAYVLRRQNIVLTLNGKWMSDEKKIEEKFNWQPSVVASLEHKNVSSWIGWCVRDGEMIAPWTMNSIKCSVTDVIQTTNTSATAKQLNPFTTYTCWSHSIWCGLFFRRLCYQCKYHSTSRARVHTNGMPTHAHTCIWQKWAVNYVIYAESEKLEYFLLRNFFVCSFCGCRDHCAFI